MAVLATWLSASTTLHAQAPLDTDGDGLPDAWEIHFGLDPASPAGDDGADGDPDGDGISNLDELLAQTHPRAQFTQTFAEGALGYFRTRLALANVDATRDATVLVRFVPDAGQVISEVLHVPALRRRTLNTEDVSGLSSAFAVTIESDVRIVADRTMSWDDEGADSHAETGLTATSRTWYFAEGATGSTFQLFYLISNPLDTTATVRATYLPAVGAPVVKLYAVAPRTRYTVWLNHEDTRLAAAEVGASFVSDSPVVIERAMYTNGQDSIFGGGHSAAGAQKPSLSWYLAEGATGSYFDTYVLLSNPMSTAADARVTFLLPSGNTIERVYTVAPFRRTTVWVNHADPRLEDTAVSVQVDVLNGVPVIAERAMWWPNRGAHRYYAGHASVGATRAARRWAFADGEVGTSPTRDQYLLIANPSATTTTARVTLLFETADPITREWALAPSSRLNVDIAVEFPEALGQRFGAIVESVDTAGTGIVVERSQYEDRPGRPWGSGTNALGVDISTAIAPLDDVALATDDRGVVIDVSADVVQQGTTFEVRNPASELLTASIDPLTGHLVLDTVAGASGTTRLTVVATGPDGLTEQRVLGVRVGSPVEREHVERLSGSSSYELPGADDRAVTPRVVRLANTGIAPATGIRLYRAGQDWTSLDRIMGDIVSPEMSDDTRARAIWQFARTQRVKWWSPTVSTDIHDPVMLFHGFGYVFCDDISSAMVAMFEHAGLPARTWDFSNHRHTAVEAFYDGDWHLFDADLDALFLEWDNATVAGVEDLMQDPTLIHLRAGPAFNQDYVDIYTDFDNHVAYPGHLLARTGHEIAHALRPEEHLELRWAGPADAFYYDGRANAPPSSDNGRPPASYKANGWLVGRFSARAPKTFGNVDLHGATIGNAGGLSAIVPHVPDVPAFVDYTLASPLPVIGGRVSAVVATFVPGDRVEIQATAYGPEVDLDWPELIWGRFRLPDVFRGEVNVTTYDVDPRGSAVHARSAGTNASLTYAFVSGRTPATSVVVGGDLFRAGEADMARVLVSLDNGTTWLEVARANTPGIVPVDVDVTTLVGPGRPFLLRYEFRAAHHSWHAGLDALRVSGVDPFDFQTIWSSDDQIGPGPAEIDVDVTTIVQDTRRSRDRDISHQLTIRTILTSTSTVPTVGLLELTPTAILQVAPLSLPTPGVAPVQMVFESTTTGAHEITVTHAWTEDPSRRAPGAPQPVAAQHTVDASAPFVLQWTAPDDPDGDAIASYRLEICERQDCLYPVTSFFDVVTGSGATSYVVTNHSWFTRYRTYYWRVRARDARGQWGPASAPARFDVTADVY